MIRMIKKSNPVRIWVDPDFQKRLKVESTMKGMPIIKYTEYLAKEESTPFIKSDDGKLKKRFWNFEL
jgi:hypothetical protein